MAIKSKIRTKEKDRGFKRIKRELEKLKERPYVKIGFPSKSPETGKPHLDSEFITVLDVAIFHEFGTVNLPERSFVRASFDANRNKYLKMNRKLLEKIYRGSMTVEKALNFMGETILQDIKDFITEERVEPVSIAVQEGRKTLINTSQMLNSLTYVKVMKR